MTDQTDQVRERLGAADGARTKYLSRAELGAAMTIGADFLADEIESGRGEMLTEHDRRRGHLRMRNRHAREAGIGGGAK